MCHSRENLEGVPYSIGDRVILRGTYGMGPYWLGEKPGIGGVVLDMDTKWMVVELDDELVLPIDEGQGWPSYSQTGETDRVRTAAGKWLLLKKGWVGQEWNEPAGRINVFLTSVLPVLRTLSGDRGVGVWAESHAELRHDESESHGKAKR